MTGFGLIRTVPTSPGLPLLSRFYVLYLGTNSRASDDLPANSIDNCSSCCIDKKSSSELSEAINSMYRWYAKSDICYVYLEHVTDGDICASADSAFRRSPWFKRGWTLQELLAPREVVFDSRGWKRLGTKRELCDIVASITGIHRRYLLGESHLDAASIARRMSWASERQTSRPEDMAYCLFGLFDINMPLIYGEGARKAFQRVQEAIMQAYPHDHTLFAWGEDDGLPLVDLMDEYQAWTRQLSWKDSENRPRLTGLFAASPRDFAKSGHLVPSYYAAAFYRNLGLSLPTLAGRDFVCLKLPCDAGPRIWSVYYWEEPRVTSLRPCLIARLLCHSEDESINSWSTIAIRLQYSLNGGFTRIGHPVKVADVPSGSDRQRPKESITVGPEPLKDRSLQNGDILFRRMIFSGRQSTTGIDFIGGSVYDEYGGLVRGTSTAPDGIILFVKFDADESGKERGLATEYRPAFLQDSGELSLTVSVFLTTHIRRSIKHQKT